MTELAAALLRDWSLALSVANSILKNFDRAQEAVQESVYRALLNADSYDPQRPVRPWFLRIVRNVSLSEIKRASRLVAMPELLDDNSPIDTTLRQERTQEIRGAVAALSRSYRAVLHLS